MKNVLAAFARNTVFANIVLVLIFLAGGMAAWLMIRETFPEFSLDMIIISVAYPGADPEEVEEGICQKIEEAVEGLEGIKQYTTKSYENYATTLIEVHEDYDVQKVLDRVRSEVDAISTFPVDAEEPVITELLLKDAILLISLSGEMSERRLKEWAERMKDEIQALGGVSQVEVLGVRDYEIAVEVSEEKLREYGLTFNQVVRAVREGNLNMAGGTLRTEGEEIRIRTMGRKYTGREMASIVVMAGPRGDIITLDRIADIRDGFTEDPLRSYVNGMPSVFVQVQKTPEEDALQIAGTLHAFVAEKQKTLPAGVRCTVLYDTTDMLQSRIDLLVRNGAIGLVLVFLLLWFFLDHRLSFWAGMGIPVSVAGALGILWGIGGTINMVSLFGLIMVLGIVVDDAIVVGEAIYVHRQNGEAPLSSAVEGVCEVGMPVVAAVTTTIVAFAPLMYVGGIMGKFIAILPKVVIACLSISLVECLILLPAHLSHLPDPHAPSKTFFLLRPIGAIQRSTRRGLEWFVERLYTPFLSHALNWRYVSFCIAMAVLLATVGLVMGGLIKFQVFPNMDGFIMTANLEFPSGTPPDVTENAMKQVDAALVRLNDRVKTISGEPLVKSRISILGTTLTENMRDTGPNYAGVQAVLLESEKRGVHSDDLMVMWEKEIGRIPGMRSLTIEGMGAGPPGQPIEVWIQGHDMDRILAASDELREKLAEFDGVYQIRSDFMPGKREMRLYLKPYARTLGITLEDLATQVYAGYYGEEALRIQRGRNDIRVKVRYTESERTRLTLLDRMRVRTPSGREVPLTAVADVQFSSGYSTITRTDGMRRVMVSAAVDSNKANTTEIFQELNKSFFPGLKKRYPDIKAALQGEQKKMRESLSSLFVGYPLALLGIFIIIATMFRSYAQPFIIMFTIPFGIIGGVFGHLLLGYDLSIMSVFGMVALAGVVVNDAIVLIERINENLAEGMRFFQAILNGGSRRFRAIFLTTLSTVGGLTPLILETDLQARVLIPMAISLAAGVAFATVLTLVLIPSMLVILNDFRLLYRYFRTGEWVKREEVEPATERYIPEPGPSDREETPTLGIGQRI